MSWIKLLGEKSTFLSDLKKLIRQIKQQKTDCNSK